MAAHEPVSESEFLDQEAKRTRAALASLRDGITDSLKRAADPAVWTKRHPWAAVGTAAAGGVAAGVAVAGATSGTSKSRHDGHAASESGEFDTGPNRAESGKQQQGRIASGVGALFSAAASAAAVALSQAVSDIVKSSIHDAMHPSQMQHPSETQFQMPGSEMPERRQFERNGTKG